MKTARRIMIIGCGGSGKSTLARQLHQRLQLPLIHLDQLYWKPNWVESDRASWLAKSKEAAAQAEWIMDGNYGSSMDLRIERASHIIFLDFSRWTCLWRVLQRTMKYYGQSRPDMPQGCPERWSWPFLQYVWSYQRTRSPGIHKKLAKVKESKKVYVLCNDRQVADFLNHTLTS